MSEIIIRGAAPILNVAAHYWIIGGSTTDVYSAASNTLVPTADQTYADWAANNVASPIASEAELADVLQNLGTALPAWLFTAADTFIQPTPTTYTKGQLAAYSTDARWNYENTGITVTSIAAVPFTSDLASRNAVDTAWGYMNSKGTTNSISWKLSDGSFITMTTAQVNTLMTDMTTFVQACFECENANGAAINGGTITTPEQIDAAFAQIPTTFP